MIAGGGTDLDPGAPILLLGNSDGAELTRIPIDGVTREYFKPRSNSTSTLDYESGGQMGYCVFSDGTEVEEWAYYRGEAEPAVPGQ